MDKVAAAWLLRADETVFRWLNGLVGQLGVPDNVYIFLGKYLIYAVIITAALIWLAWRRPFGQKLKVLGIFLIASALTYAVIIFVFHPLWPRVRPFEALLNVTQLVPEQGSSFPSKHATFAFLIAVFIYSLFSKKVGWLFLLAALLVALGRVVVGVHYPLDVVAGAVFGILMGWGGVWISKRFCI